MKHHIVIPSKAWAVTLGGMIMLTIPATAATYAKGGMQTTTTTHGGVMTSDLPMLAPGVQELGVSGFLNWEGKTNYALHVSYGRFFTENWMFGGRVGIDGQNSDAGYAIGVFAEYNFLTGTKWVPFVGVNFDYNRLEYDDSGLNSFRAGARGGIKYFMRPNLAISASVGAAWNSNSLPDSDDFAKQIDIGLRFYF